MAFWEGVIGINAGEVKQPFTAQAMGFPPGSAFISVESADIRYRYGGATPNATDGHLLLVGQWFNIYAPDVENLKITAVGGNAQVVATVKGK